MPSWGVSQEAELFATPGWRILRADALSTSALNSAQLRYFGFGPTGPGCIGIGYILGPDSLSLFLSAPAALTDQLQSFAAAIPTTAECLLQLTAP